MKYPAGFSDVSYTVCLGLSQASEQSPSALQRISFCTLDTEAEMGNSTSPLLRMHPACLWVTMRRAVALPWLSLSRISVSPPVLSLLKPLCPMV